MMGLGILSHKVTAGFIVNFTFEMLKDSHLLPPPKKEKKRDRKNAVIKPNDMASISHLLCTVVFNDQGENFGRL